MILVHVYVNQILHWKHRTALHVYLQQSTPFLYKCLWETSLDLIFIHHCGTCIKLKMNAVKLFTFDKVLAIDDPDLPALHKIQEDKIFWNLNSFHHIMSHQEPGTL